MLFHICQLNCEKSNWRGRRWVRGMKDEINTGWEGKERKENRRRGKMDVCFVYK